MTLAASAINAYLYLAKVAMILRCSWRMFSGTRKSTTRVVMRRRKMDTVAVAVAVAGMIPESDFGVAIVEGADVEAAVRVDVATALFAGSEIIGTRKVCATRFPMRFLGRESKESAHCPIWVRKTNKEDYEHSKRTSAHCSKHRVEN